MSQWKNQSDVLAHCKRELFHTVWNILLDNDFIEAYKNGIVVKCFDGKYWHVYPRIFTYSADYPEKCVTNVIHSSVILRYGPQDTPCDHPGQGPLPMSMMPDSKITLLQHWPVEWYQSTDFPGTYLYAEQNYLCKRCNISARCSDQRCNCWAFA